MRENRCGPAIRTILYWKRTGSWAWPEYPETLWGSQQEHPRTVFQGLPYKAPLRGTHWTR